LSGLPITVVTGPRTGIGRALAEHRLARGHRVVGRRRGEAEWHAPDDEHHRLDVGDEAAAIADRR